MCDENEKSEDGRMAMMKRISVLKKHYDLNYLFICLGEKILTFLRKQYVFLKSKQSISCLFFSLKAH